MLVPLVAVCLPFWPGHMTSDTISQIAEMRSFEFTNQHAPLLMVLWKPFFELGAGPGCLLVGQVSIFLVGCYLVLRSVFGRLVASLLASAIALWPTVYGMLGYLGRDTWFVVSLLLMFGAIVRATQRDGRARAVWIAVALLAAWLTLAARQNAATTVAVALTVLSVLLPLAWLHRGGTARRTVLALATGVVLTVGLMATQAGIGAIVGIRDVSPEQYLYIYDLGGLSERDGSNLFPRDVMPARDPEIVAKRWNPDAVTALLWTPGAPIQPTPLPKRRLASLADAWRDEVMDDPLGYLAVRAELLERNLAIATPARFVHYRAVNANPWGYRSTFPEANDKANGYVTAFTINGPALEGSIVYKVWIYVLAALVGAVALLWPTRRTLTLTAVGALGLTVLTHQLGLFLSSPLNQYRLEFNVIVIALLVGAVAVGAVVRERSLDRR
jgi:hypothetical protein